MLVFKVILFHNHQILMSLPSFFPQRPFNLAHLQPDLYHQPPLPFSAQLNDCLNKYNGYQSAVITSVSIFHNCFLIIFKTFYTSKSEKLRRTFTY